MKGAHGTDLQAFGPATYFASHAWSYKFGALVSMLENHYAQLPGSKGGARYLPVFYWVDILAVSQHFSGDFKDHPDSDFQGVEFQVVVDVKDSKDTRATTLQVIAGSIEVRTAQASVSSDKAYILGCIEAGLGINAFNNVIRKRLREALLAAVTPKAVEMGDTAALHELFKAGGCVRPDSICDLSAHFRLASEAELLRVLSTMRVRDLRPRGLALSGRCRCREVALTDAGLRGWDGSGFSLREYGESETGRTLWPYLPASGARTSASGVIEPSRTASEAGLVVDGEAESGAGAGAGAGTVPPRPVALPAGRAALWAGVGASTTLRMLCLHQAVLEPRDLQLLGAALQSCRSLETLQAVRCTAPAADNTASGGGNGDGTRGSGGGDGGGATARLTGDLLVLGLSCPRLRQLHLRPGEAVLLEAFTQAPAPPEDLSSPLRRLTLAPVALGPTALRQLGAALALMRGLQSLVAGLDPAPPTGWMPQEGHERDHWLAHEERHEPEMAARRRRHLGLDEEGQAAFVANAWDLSAELLLLPDPVRGGAAQQQRAAGLAFCLALSCGWRDMAAHNRAYARWAWARRAQPQDPALAELRNRKEDYRALLAELLKAAPESFATKFNPEIERVRRGTKSRLQASATTACTFLECSIRVAVAST
ncbi:hypothetical protein GPECTOR_61g817 [Gonium pectorale]|uniref:Uncharacterized protein n=1 Tax=Gonium pectorale TaxID=33097 RepID=A0A150G4W6_GONPE|nr:hypothetical protein GPECTOR_61g817 [Gonium pectorale]|eukprot:KXZ44864.1 hypothetical protein GPECTOR_61g817 [Gonium pectorale]